MAKESVKIFYKELSENKELQERLAKAQESYAGELNNRQAVVEAVLLPVAKEAGYDFTAEELKAVEREQAEEKGIREEELENVSGGSGGCFIIGLGSGASVCVRAGVQADISSGVNTNAAGDYICAFVGVGFGEWF